MWMVQIITSTCHCFSELDTAAWSPANQPYSCVLWRRSSLRPCFRYGVLSATLASFRRLLCLRQTALLPTKTWSASVFGEQDVACLRGFLWRPDRLTTGSSAQLLAMRDSWGCCLCWRVSVASRVENVAYCATFCSVVSACSECQSCSSPITNRHFVFLPMLQVKGIWFMSSFGE